MLYGNDWDQRDVSSNDDKITNTVWGGGTLEWPPGAVTSTRTFMFPFSAMPGFAMMEPNLSVNPAKTKSIPFSVKCKIQISGHLTSFINDHCETVFPIGTF